MFFVVPNVFLADPRCLMVETIMIITAVDPGDVRSALITLDDKRIIRKEYADNATIRGIIRDQRADLLAVEMIKSYGMAVGDSVFMTCVWIGRFLETWDNGTNAGKTSLLLPRKTIAGHICGSGRANDSNIRTALIDRLGPVGTKGNPGPCYGIKADMWSALAIAHTARDLYGDILL